MNDIFGDNGLVSSASLDIFDMKVQEFENKFCHLVSFMNYFNIRIKEIIRNKVVHPNILHQIGTKWTNNYSDSVNHVLKAAFDWKKKSLPDLITTIYRIVHNQYRNIDRVLFGMEKYVLVPNWGIVCHETNGFK